MGKLCRACRGVRSWSVRLWAAAGVLVPGWSATLHAQASLPVDPDEIVVTCHSGYPPDFTGQPTYDPSRPNAYVVALFNTANPVAQGAPLGPSYVKLGQFLATRADIVGPEVADTLGRLRDEIEPFVLRHDHLDQQGHLVAVRQKTTGHIDDLAPGRCLHRGGRQRIVAAGVVKHCFSSDVPARSGPVGPAR